MNEKKKIAAFPRIVFSIVGLECHLRPDWMRSSSSEKALKSPGPA